MSLINEALKRARQTHAHHATVNVAEPPLEPVVKRALARKTPAWLPAAASIGVLILGVWFITLWWRSSETVATPAPSHDPAADSSQMAMSIAATFAAKASDSGHAAPALPVFVGASEHSAHSQPAPLTQTPRPALAVTPNVTPSDPSVTPSAPAPAQAEPSPATTIALDPQRHDAPETASASPTSSFKLQGIFYRLNKASVLINNQTLFVGDEIEGAKVVGIERRSVQLQVAGKTHVLKLR